MSTIIPWRIEFADPSDPTTATIHPCDPGCDDPHHIAYIGDPHTTISIHYHPHLGHYVIKTHAPRIVDDRPVLVGHDELRGGM